MDFPHQELNKIKFGFVEERLVTLRLQEIVAMTQTQDIPASIVVNLSAHPLAEEQRSEIEQRTYIEEDINEPAHCSPINVAEYIQSLFNRIGLTLEEWNTKSIILVLPGLSPIPVNEIFNNTGINTNTHK